MKKITTILLGLICWITFANAQTNIADARTFPLNSTVTVTGIVTNGAELGTIRYMEDGTAGIACYPGTGSVPFSPNRGDSISVTGTLKDYNNLLEIDPITSVTIHTTGNTLPTPQLITPIQIGEPYEAELVRIDSVVFANGGSFFAGSTNYNFTSNGETGQVRINNASPLVGQLIPVSQVNLVAIASQYLTFYQLLPRDNNDLIPLSSIFLTSNLTVSNITTTALDLSWTTNIAGSTNLKYGLTSSFELGTINLGGSTISHLVNLPGLTPATIYYVQAYSVAGTDTAFSATKLVATASNSTGEIIVYFNHFVDNTASTVTNAIEVADFPDTIISYIDKAQSTLDISVYNNNNLNIVTAINNAYNRGVTVRYVTDLTTFNNALTSLNPNIEILKGNIDGIMHNKFVIIDANTQDSSWVLSGSTNWTPNNLFDDYNNLIIIQDEALAKAYTLEFEEMWGSTTAIPNIANSNFGADKTDNTPHEFNIGGRMVELYFSPSDNTTVHLVNTIVTSNTDLEFALLSFTRNDLGTEVLNAHNGGVSVKGIMESINDTGSEYAFLTTNGVDLQSHLGIPYIFHHKYAVIDATNAASDPILITGSHNWSTSAETKNDENTLIIHDEIIANMYLEEFMARYCELVPCAFSTMISDSADATCNGNCDGWATVAAGGGTQPYTYLWNDPLNQTTPTASGLCAGTYISTVIDANDNAASDTVVITEPVAIILDSTTSTIATCGIADGNITVYATGGSGTSLEYSIDNGATFQPSSAFNSLNAGIYSIIIRDSINCTQTTSITVINANAPLLTVSSFVDISCNGDASGIINASSSGGNPPYQYSIDGGAFQPDSSFTGLTAGNHLITVKDASSCESSIQQTLSEPSSALTGILSSTNESSGGANDGTASISVSGGALSYTYSWNTMPPQTTDSIGGLAPGDYIVTVTDFNGCTLIDSVTITSGVGIDELANKNKVMLFPNPNNGIFTVQYTLSENTDIALSISELTGRIIYKETLVGKTGINQHQLNQVKLSPGIYFLKIIAGENITTRKLIKE